MIAFYCNHQIYACPALHSVRPVRTRHNPHGWGPLHSAIPVNLPHVGGDGASGSLGIPGPQHCGEVPRITQGFGDLGLCGLPVAVSVQEICWRRWVLQEGAEANALALHSWDCAGRHPHWTHTWGQEVRGRDFGVQRDGRPGATDTNLRAEAEQHPLWASRLVPEWIWVVPPAYGCAWRLYSHSSRHIQEEDATDAVHASKWCRAGACFAREGVQRQSLQDNTLAAPATLCGWLGMSTWRLAPLQQTGVHGG